MCPPKQEYKFSQIGLRFGMIVSQWPWSLGFSLYSLFLALGYIGCTGAFNPFIFVIGFGLLVLNCYSWSLLLKPLIAVRPHGVAIRIGQFYCVLGFLTWITSVLLHIEVSTTPLVRWNLGDAGIDRVVYQTRSPKFADSPFIRIRLKLSPCPVGIGLPSLSRGRLRDGSVLTMSWPTWGIFVSSVLPVLVMRELNRCRIRPLNCRQCEYDLTGNVSGTCPECGCATESLRKKDCKMGP